MMAGRTALVLPAMALLVMVHESVNCCTTVSSSAAFGSLYNSYGRQIRLQIRFDH